MIKLFRIIYIWVVVFVIIFSILELGAIFYIHFCLDEEEFGHYASVKQIVNRIRKNKNYFKVTFHPYTGYIPTPNYKKDCNQHNSYGFRGKELEGKKEGEIWIACVGESTTYDSDLKCWDKAYPAQLEQYLNEQGIRAQVINAGVDGWTSFEILIDFMLRISKFPVDIVIYYGGLNDIGQTRFLYPVKNEILARDISDARQGIAGMFNYPFWENSTFLRIILVSSGLAMPHPHRLIMQYAPEYRIQDFIFQLSTNTYPSGIFKEIPVEKILALNPPFWFENNIRNLVLFAKSKTITPVLVNYMVNQSRQKDQLLVNNPQAKEVIKKIMGDAIVEMNSVLEKISKELDVPLFNLPEVYPVNDSNMFLDLVHNTEQGARVKAELIGKFLINSQIIKKQK